MHLGMPECHKLFLGHCDLNLWPSFQELLCPEHICYIIWCRNPKIGVVISLEMAEWCIPFWVTLTWHWLLASFLGFSCYTDPKWKLYIVFKSIYFDDKLSFGVNFFDHRIFNALSMSLKKILDENHKLHNFYKQFSSEWSKWKFLKQ